MSEGQTILLADDSRLARTVIARALEGRGYRVLLAEDGLAAVEQAWAKLPDLVLLDVDMPRMNGYQVARLLRSETRTADIPIVILSSREAAGDIFWGLEAGADAYVTKSAGEVSLLSTVARVLHERGAQRAPAPRPAPPRPEESLDVLARLNQLLDQKLFEATVLNQIGQLATELRDYRRAAERAGHLLARVLDYQVCGLLFLQAEPAEGLVIIRGQAPFDEPAVRARLLAPLGAEIVADLPPPAALPLTIVRVEGSVDADEPLLWRALALGDEPDLMGSFCVLGRAPAPQRGENREWLRTLALHLFTALDNARLYARLRETAITDALTGVFNRRYFADQLTRLCQRCAQDQRPLSVILLDVDHFKRLNDTLGHQAGDLALRELGAVLRETLRPTDFAARYGGEEFAVVLQDTDAAAALQLAERLRRVLRERWARAGLSPL
ncbi:MAG TPA: diguanylate cyclase, partial [Chloroflexota bacterium]|nr:diguanylate cyclase [Chloroflexota bacterium]